MWSRWRNWEIPIICPLYNFQRFLWTFFSIEFTYSSFQLSIYYRALFPDLVKMNIFYNLTSVKTKISKWKRFILIITLENDNLNTQKFVWMQNRNHLLISQYANPFTFNCWFIRDEKPKLLMKRKSFCYKKKKKVVTIELCTLIFARIFLFSFLSNPFICFS